MAELAAMKFLRLFKDRTNNWSLVKQDPSFSV